jgi:hypothetical protein
MTTQTNLNTNIIDTTNTSLNLKSLEKEFNLVLSMYDKSYQNYLNELQNGSNNVNSYIILGVGLGNDLYMKETFSTNWLKVNDTSGTVNTISTMPNNGLMCADTTGNIFIKQHYTDINWTMINNTCCVLKAIMAPDQSIIGLQKDNMLYVRKTLNDSWTGPINPTGETMIDFTICPDGSVLCVGSNNGLYKYSNYKTLNSNWSYLGDQTCCVKSITVAPDGKLIAVGNSDNSLYYMDSYQNISSSWTFMGSNSCCVQSITTVNNNPLNDCSVLPSNRVAYCDVNISKQDCLSKGLCYDDSISGAPYCYNKKQAVQQLQKINNKLIDLNQQIQKELQKSNDANSNNTDINKLNGNTIQEVYQKLLDDKDKIDVMLKEEEVLDRQQNDTTIQVERNQALYRMFFLLALIIVIILLKNLATTSSSNTNMYGGGFHYGLFKYLKNITKNPVLDDLLNFIILFLFLGLAYVFNHNLGYCFWGLMVIAYVVYKLYK